MELSERLAALAPPGLIRCFYADNGSSAVEVALKMSFHYWRNLRRSRGRTRFITLANSYHGETLGALAVGDVALYKETYAPLLMDADHRAFPGLLHCASPASPARSIPALQFARHGAMRSRGMPASVCAVIVEPLVQCAGYMRMYDPVYLQAAAGGVRPPSGAPDRRRDRRRLRAHRHACSPASRPASRRTSCACPRA